MILHSNEILLYQAEWFGFYCLAVAALTIIVYKFIVFIDPKLKK